VRQRPDKLTRSCCNEESEVPSEMFMYIGLGTLLVIALVIYFVRRA
jgi:hypothetical protein